MRKIRLSLESLDVATFDVTAGVTAHTSPEPTYLDCATGEGTCPDFTCQVTCDAHTCINGTCGTNPTVGDTCGGDGWCTWWCPTGAQYCPSWGCTFMCTFDCSAYC